MSECEAIKPSPLVLAMNPLLYGLQDLVYRRCLAEKGIREGDVPQLIALQNLLNVALPYAVMGTAIGVAALAAKAYSTRTIIREEWKNQPAPSGMERLGRERAYLKDWFSRNKKHLQKIGSLGLLAALGLIATQKPPGEPVNAGGWGGFEKTL